MSNITKFVKLNNPWPVINKGMLDLSTQENKDHFAISWSEQLWKDNYKENPSVERAKYIGWAYLALPLIMFCIFYFVFRDTNDRFANSFFVTLFSGFIILPILGFILWIYWNSMQRSAYEGLRFNSRRRSLLFWPDGRVSFSDVDLCERTTLSVHNIASVELKNGSEFIRQGYEERLGISDFFLGKLAGHGEAPTNCINYVNIYDDLGVRYTIAESVISEDELRPLVVTIQNTVERLRRG